MIWAAWRTQRLQLTAVVGLVLLVAVWVVVTGLTRSNAVAWKYWTDAALYALYVLPFAVGVGVGAPLVAGELDRRTDRLAWTQGMSRRQWLGWKVAIGAAVVAVSTALLALLVQWWSSTADIAPTSNALGPTMPKIVPSVFDVTGVVIIAYALFAFALGVALGTVIRRPFWTAAAALPVFVVVRVLVRFDVRPSLVTPVVQASQRGNLFAIGGGAWFLGSGIAPVGRTSPPTGLAWREALRRFYACATSGIVTPGQQYAARSSHCLVSHHLHFVVRYQPASHYWALQGAEAGIFVAAAALLVVLTILAVRRIAG